MDRGSVVALVETGATRPALIAEGSMQESGNARSADGGVPASFAAAAQRLIDERTIRRRFLSDDLFHEPAWDMLLALYVAQHGQRVMNVKTLVRASQAPITTSQRWIDHLATLGLVTRVTDPADRRRIEVSLSETGLKALEEYLRALQ